MGKINNNQICLEDDLLLEYYKFQNNKEYDKNIILHLLNYYKPHLTNAKQLSRIKEKLKQFDINLGSEEMQKIASAEPYEKYELEKLVQENTNLKLILSQDINKSSYPFVSILGNEPIESNYAGTFRNTPRTKAIEHIKALCETAANIYIYDKHLNEYSANPLDPKFPFKKGLLNDICDLFPKTNFDLLYGYRDNQNKIINDIDTKILSYWKKRNKNIKSTNLNSKFSYKKFHDRYLIIDSKIEIILTSGFDHLFSDDGDFTYIVRYLK